MARIPELENVPGLATTEYDLLMASDSDSEAMPGVLTSEYDLLMDSNSESDASTVFDRGAFSSTKASEVGTVTLPGVTSNEYDLLMASDSETDDDELHCPTLLITSTPATPKHPLSGAPGSEYSPASLLSPATDFDHVPRRLFSTPVPRLAVADPSPWSSPGTGSTTISESDSNFMDGSPRGVDSTSPAVRACQYPLARNPFEQAAVDTDWHNTTTRRATERKKRKNASSEKKKKVIKLVCVVKIH